MDIIAVKSKDGFYISENKSSSGYYTPSISSYFYDGINPEPTFNKYWFKITKEPKEITKKVSQPYINHRYELIDPAMETKTIKPVFMRDEVAYIDDYEWIWKDEYKHLQSLYELVYDTQPDIFEPIEFSFKVILEIDDIYSPDFKYPVLSNPNLSHRGVTFLNPESIKHQIIDEIVFPAIVLPQKPCSLTSKQSYELIRQHVKENINPKLARITSDYEFCFTVKKIIELSDPVKYEVDVNNNWFSNRKRKPKMVTRYRSEREVEIFEMTHTGKNGNYKGYTPVDGFKGKDHEDLKANIDDYLKGLMEYINEPVCECKACNGRGVVIK